MGCLPRNRRPARPLWSLGLLVYPSTFTFIHSNKTAAPFCDQTGCGCERRFTLRSSNFSVKSMILANWWNRACCDSRCWRAVMSLEHSTLNRFGTVLSADQTTTHSGTRIFRAKYPRRFRNGRQRKWRRQPPPAGPGSSREYGN